MTPAAVGVTMTAGASPTLDFVVFLMAAGVIAWFLELLFGGGKR